MNFGERLERLRKYRNYPAEDLARWIGISRQAWYKKEDSGSITLEQLSALCEKAEIDARFFTGQIERIEDADLKSEHKNHSYDEIVESNRELADTVREFAQAYRPSDEDPVLQRVRINRDLYELAELLYKEESRLINKVYGLAYAMKSEAEHSRDEDGDSRERANGA